MSQIGRVFAVDHDAGSQNSALRYSLRPIPGPVGQMTKLYITVSVDGIIYTYHSKLDREHTPLISFEVVATDNGNPMLSAFASVLVRVLDMNDNSPIWLFPKQFGHQSTINVSQHATIGLQLAQLKAVDPDEGLNGEVVYSILHGNEDGFLEVDSLNGALYLSKSLYRFPYNTTSKQNNAPRMNQTQRETELHRKSSQMQQWTHRRTDNIYIHRIILKASDRGTPPLFNTTVLNIAILPFDEKESLDKGDHHVSDKKSLMMQQFSGVNVDGIMSRFDHDLIIMIILITLTSIISLVLVTAICLIRCRNVSFLRPSLTPRLHNSCNQSQHQQQQQQQKIELPIRWWMQPTRWFGHRSQQNSQTCNAEMRLRGSCPELCEKNKSGEVM
ncbi:Cadherin domain protein [Paragonimus heterotremus]|uniref:Cadherin domain protein n=1 Tax=Paragonimus heterotremus TaxID=100268 RepID=A0A8J4WJR4_9TREM|nr:Cadherin domain protein [Paragonimus heterotremus]